MCVCVCVWTRKHGVFGAVAPPSCHSARARMHACACALSAHAPPVLEGLVSMCLAAGEHTHHASDQGCASAARLSLAAPAGLALAPLAVVGADARASAVLAVAPAAVMLTDARAPAVLAGAPLAVMLADARAPAVLAGAPLAVMLADARAPAVLAVAPAAVMLADARAPAVLAGAPPPPHRPPAPQIPPRRQPAPRGTRGTCPAASRARNAPSHLRRHFPPHPRQQPTRRAAP
jgi:hypothetical protein